MIITIIIINLNSDIVRQKCHTSHVRDFSTGRKKEKERRENWINIVQYPKSPHMTPERDGRETEENMGGKKPQRFRPGHSSERESGRGQNSGLT